MMEYQITLAVGTILVVFGGWLVSNIVSAGLKVNLDDSQELKKLIPVLQEVVNVCFQRFIFWVVGIYLMIGVAIPMVLYIISQIIEKAVR